MKCGFYLPPHARYDYLLHLPEQEDVAKKIKEAMQDIEKYKSELDGVLPKDEYVPLTRTDKTIPAQLLVEIIEPHKGTVYDPACGSGGMFVQSQLFVDLHRDELDERGEKWIRLSVWTIHQSSWAKYKLWSILKSQESNFSWSECPLLAISA